MSFICLLTVWKVSYPTFEFTNETLCLFGYILFYLERRARACTVTFCLIYSHVRSYLCQYNYNFKSVWFNRVISEVISSRFRKFSN